MRCTLYRQFWVIAATLVSFHVHADDELQRALLSDSKPSVLASALAQHAIAQHRSPFIYLGNADMRDAR